MSRAADLLHHSRRFTELVAHRFVADGAPQRAAALTYTTLLSLVPLMTVMLAVFSAFPVADRIATELQDFVFDNFVPAAGAVVQSHLQEFSSKAGRLTGIGSGFLIVTALLLMATIDRAFNAIWHVRRRRHLVAIFMVYWAILSLGPILIGISVAVTSYLISLPLVSDTAATFGNGRRLLALAPVAISAVAFTLLYVVVPNRRVRARHALAGGLLAAVLFESAKRGFAFYLTQFPTYEAIYGALAAIPIFLIWIYLSWLITLLGAVVAASLDGYRPDWQPHGEAPELELERAYRLLNRLWEAQRCGDALRIEALTATVRGVTQEELEHLLDKLQGARLVLRTEERRWALARDLAAVRLYDLWRAGPFVVPPPAAIEDPRLRAITTGVDERLGRDMAQPLAELFAAAAAPASAGGEPEAVEAGGRFDQRPRHDAVGG